MSNGKGDSPRPYKTKQFQDNYNEINWKSKKKLRKCNICNQELEEKCFTKEISGTHRNAFKCCSRWVCNECIEKDNELQTIHQKLQ